MREKQQYYIDCIERLKGGAIERLDWEKLYSLMDDLSENLPIILHPIDHSAKFARARILEDDKKFDSIHKLSYPKQENCKTFGRCNRPNQSVLYAGVGTELLFSEINAHIGDIVGIIHMQPTQKLYFARVGALNLWRRTSGICLLHEEIKKEIEIIYKNPENIVSFLFDAFISDYFSRSGNQHIYKLTSAYTSAILNSNSNISGIIYDSVNHTAGACLAIKPEHFNVTIKPSDIQIVRITSYLGYGIYDFEQIAYTNNFDGEMILWNY